MELKTHSTRAGCEWCLRQAFKPSFGLVWPWPLTKLVNAIFWSKRRNQFWRKLAQVVQRAEAWNDNLLRLKNILLTSSVTDEWTNGRTERQVVNVMPPPTSLACRGHRNNHEINVLSFGVWDCDKMRILRIPDSAHLKFILCIVANCKWECTLHCLQRKWAPVYLQWNVIYGHKCVSYWFDPVTQFH